MRLFNLLLIPLLTSFLDCNKPREPSQPVSDENKALHSQATSQEET